MVRVGGDVGGKGGLRGERTKVLVFENELTEDWEEAILCNDKPV